MSFMMLSGLTITLIAMAGVPLCLMFDQRTSSETLPRLSFLLLIVAGILCGFMTLFILAAAPWGLETRVPLGLGVYPYLIPALSLPAFLLLRFWSPSVLAAVFWGLTTACAVAWYFGDRAERAFEHLRPVTDPTEKLGMFFNAFTLIYIMISVLIQLAAFCGRRLRQGNAEVALE